MGAGLPLRGAAAAVAAVRAGAASPALTRVQFSPPQRNPNTQPSIRKTSAEARLIFES